MAQNPFSPQSNMSFFGGVNDMATMLPGGRSTFNSMGPATAAAPAGAGAAGAATPAADPNAAAIAAAAAALGTGSNSAATGAAASPFAPASNLNFSTSSLAAPITSAPSTPVIAAPGSLVGGSSQNPWQTYDPSQLPADAVSNNPMDYSHPSPYTGGNWMAGPNGPVFVRGDIITGG